MTQKTSSKNLAMHSPFFKAALLLTVAASSTVVEATHHLHQRETATKSTEAVIPRTNVTAGDSADQAVATPRIVMVDQDGTRRETGGSEGCFGTEANVNLAALPPNVIAVTYSEYGCKGEPITALCGQGVAERLGMPTSLGHDQVAHDDSRTVAYDTHQVARFRTTPKMGTIACTFPGAAMTYGKSTYGRAIGFDAQRHDLERYSGMASVRMPQPVSVKSVYLARVGPSAESTCPLISGPIGASPVSTVPATPQPAATFPEVGATPAADFLTPVTSAVVSTSTGTAEQLSGSRLTTRPRLFRARFRGPVHVAPSVEMTGSMSAGEPRSEARSMGGSQEADIVDIDFAGPVAVQTDHEENV